jgi:hypothetical protein
VINVCSYKRGKCIGAMVHSNKCTYITHDVCVCVSRSMLACVGERAVDNNKEKQVCALYSFPARCDGKYTQAHTHAYTRTHTHTHTYTPDKGEMMAPADAHAGLGAHKDPITS